jgi:hypothetical protein
VAVFDLIRASLYVQIYRHCRLLLILTHLKHLFY